MRCSLTVRVPMKRSSCWTYAEREANPVAVTGIPLIARYPVTDKLSGARNVREFSNVVLPAPLEPIRAINSPGYATPVTVNKNRILQPSKQLLWFLTPFRWSEVKNTNYTTLGTILTSIRSGLVWSSAFKKVSKNIGNWFLLIVVSWR